MSVGWGICLPFHLHLLNKSTCSLPREKVVTNYSLLSSYYSPFISKSLCKGSSSLLFKLCFWERSCLLPAALCGEYFWALPPVLLPHCHFSFLNELFLWQWKKSIKRMVSDCLKSYATLFIRQKDWVYNYATILSMEEAIPRYWRFTNYWL